MCLQVRLAITTSNNLTNHYVVFGVFPRGWIRIFCRNHIPPGEIEMPGDRFVFLSPGGFEIQGECHPRGG